MSGLPFETTDDELKKMFDPFGTVTSATVAGEKETGRSKGFGFVEMPDDAEAKNAIGSLNGTSVGGREMRVEVANLPKK